MQTARYASVATAVLLLVSCADTSTPSGGVTSNRLEFALYSQARLSHTRLQERGADVSPLAFKEEAGMWTFTSSLPITDEPAPVLASGDCSTSGTGHSGTTQCDLYSEADRERTAMENDGYDVSDITWNSTDEQWEFDWVETFDSV